MFSFHSLLQFACALSMAMSCCSATTMQRKESALLLLLASWAVAAVDADLQSDAEMLLQFKSGLTGSAAALHDWHAAAATNACNWTGVSCDRNRKRVVGLSLPARKLMGSISPSLGNLPYLTDLNLSRNNLSNSIPAGLFSGCSSLSSLSLSFNSLYGAIPEEICNCSSLRRLDLSNNGLSGSLPESMGKLFRLQALDFGTNKINSSIPLSLFNCTELVSLGLYNNFLKGDVPSQIGFLSQLQVLKLFYNNLTGEIPMSLLQNCTQLVLLDLSFNNVSGNLRPEIAGLWRLQHLWLEGANLSGTIPASVGNLTRLLSLELAFNKFTGTIPKSLGLLKAAQIIVSVSGNALTGELPADLANLTNVHLLKARMNLLTGPIPPEFGRMGQNLIGLFLDSNLLSGTIPPDLSNCTALDTLWLYNNLLTGIIPQSFSPKLSTLYLQNNKLEGPIPAGLANCTFLQDLSLSNNMLSGEIPFKVIGIKTMVKNFSVAGNLLTGIIPTAIGNMELVSAVNLSRNLLRGEIPTTVANLEALVTLDLSSNYLSGQIPSILSRLPLLSFLNLSNNRLEGPVPDTGVFRNLTADSFYGNTRLCGPILKSTCANSSGAARAENHKRRNVIILLACTAGAITGLSLSFFVILCCGRKSATSVSVTEPDVICFNERDPFPITDADLWKLRGGYSKSDIVGEGRFSTVFRSVLSSGTVVAVKVLNRNDSNTTEAIRTFTAELQALGQVRHRNLVRILGFSSGVETKTLVLEYIANGTLDKHLHDIGGLSWAVRWKIIVGISQGLLYLHHENFKAILHCDLKPSNILLDADMEPRLSDFGLARIIPHAETSHGVITSGLKGSFGYMAPEYATAGKITAKGDIYSYGIVLLELITGTRPTSEMFTEETDLPKWVRAAFEKATPMQVVDPTIRQDAEQNATSVRAAIVEVMRMALLCVAQKPEDRPTMRDLFGMLMQAGREAAAAKNTIL